jgi:hypothetical protein
MLTNSIRAVRAGLRSEAQALAALRASQVFGWDVELSDPLQRRTEPPGRPGSRSAFKGSTSG